LNAWTQKKVVVEIWKVLRFSVTKPVSWPDSRNKLKCVVTGHSYLYVYIGCLSVVTFR
jgi:hypothetical protein